MELANTRGQSTGPSHSLAQIMRLHPLLCYFLIAFGLTWPIRPADEIYNAKDGGASSPQKPKEVSPTKKLLPSSQFHLSFFTGPTQIALLHFHVW